MDNNLHAMIFKRKSFHLFRNTGTGTIPIQQLEEIKRICKTLKPLDKSIEVAIEIVPAKATTCARGAEYCILLYSEQKNNYLQNIGYMGEQLDLCLASMDIGALWYGIGKPKQPKLGNLAFVIMIAIKKVDADKFRKDMFKSKRKPVNEIWTGDMLKNVTDIVRFAPSACNMQPWTVEYINHKLSVYRYKKPGRRGIMPAAKVTYYNKIDIGIFLCFMDLCLEHEGIGYTKTLFHDDSNDEKVLTAEYELLF